MSSIWITHDEYRTNTKQEKIKKVLNSIGEEYEERILKAQNKDASTSVGLLLIHPTQETLSLKTLSEDSPNFRRLCTAIANGIDIVDMYGESLKQKMGIQEGDQDMDDLFQGILNRFGNAGILSKIRLLINNVIEEGETFSWIPFRCGTSNIPTIPHDYIIVYFSPDNEWVARDLDNNPLNLLFISEVDSMMRPRSTVSYMMKPSYDMDLLRSHFLQSVVFTSKPSYVASFHRQNDTCKKGADTKLLDETLVNQARMNEQLESMVMDKVRESSNYADNSQKRTTLHGNLNRFVSDLGSTHLKEMKEKRLLEMSVHDLKEKLKESEVGMSNGYPQRWVVPEDYDVSAVKLNVQPIDLLSFERRHDRDWLATCTGYNGEGSHVKGGRERTSETSHMEMIHMVRKQKMYGHIIIYDVLKKWIEKSGISLTVPKDMYNFEKEK